MEIERGKVRTREEIMACFKDGQTIAIGGQAGAYMPWDLLDMLEESGVKHLTICSIDACNPGFAISRLIENGQVDKMITTHIGTNPVAQKLLAEGKLEVEFFPMGSFIEKMRDGGAGIGGFLTKTGLGTDMEKGKQIVTTSDGERYILEEAIHADVALQDAVVPILSATLLTTEQVLLHILLWQHVQISPSYSATCTAT